MMPLSDAMELAGELAAAFPGRGVREEHIGAWARELAEMPSSAASRVVERLRRNLKQPPTVAQIRECLRDVLALTPSPRLPETTSVTPEESGKAGAAAIGDYFDEHPDRRREPREETKARRERVRAALRKEVARREAVGL